MRRREFIAGIGIAAAWRLAAHARDSRPPSSAFSAMRRLVYTNDEKGIRHALVDEGTAKVDEADALFMLGACAAFVSYLITKARMSGLPLAN